MHQLHMSCCAETCEHRVGWEIGDGEGQVRMAGLEVARCGLVRGEQEVEDVIVRSGAKVLLEGQVVVIWCWCGGVSPRCSL